MKPVGGGGERKRALLRRCVIKRVLGGGRGGAGVQSMGVDSDMGHISSV